MSKQKAIPDKMYFRIGDAAELLEVKPYVLRYWETEFPDIKPVKSQSNQRLYKRKDVELLMAIKHLLYEEKFTINGARQHLKDQLKIASGARPEEEQLALGTEPEKKVAVAAPSKGGTPANMKKVFEKLKSELQWFTTELRK